MNSVQLKRKRKNQGIEAIFERSAPGGANRLQANRAELLKDSINKDLWSTFTFALPSTPMRLFPKLSIPIFEFSFST